MSQDSQPPLADLVDLLAQLRQDEQQEELVLRQRDRKIGKSQPQALRHDRRGQVLAWLHQVQADEPGPGQRAVQATRLVSLLLAILGAALGWGSAAAVFHYDGTRPVNVVHVLAAYVALPLLLLLLTTLAMLPRSWMRFIPGMIGLQETLGFLSPGRLSGLMIRLLPQTHRTALSTAAGRTRAHQAVFGQVQKWLLMTWSQTFAAAFFAGALAGCLGLVVFSDLAFAWSTTLQIDAAAFHRIVHKLALPWSWFWPDAAPTRELVEQTQYYRFGGGQLGQAIEVAKLGGWWPFLVACVLCYALLPRVLTMTLARARLRRAIDATLLRVPGVTALIDRLDSELVQTTAAAAELPEPAGGEALPAAAAALQGRRAVIINWAQAGDHVDDLARALGVQIALRLEAGGAALPQQDIEAMRQAAAAGADSAVLLPVRAWEPPLLDLADFLRDLRRALGPARPIVVLPLGEAGPPSDAHVQVWRRMLARLGDPWLSVRPAAAEPAP